MKKYLLLLSLFLTQLTAMAYDFCVDGIYYDRLMDLTVEVTNETGLFDASSYSEDVTIPLEITVDGEIYSVVSIGPAAFANCSSLTSVTIPESVTYISSEAFWGCTGLTSVDIPNSVTEIGYDAFNSCTGLTSVSIGEGLETISNYAFANCVSLESVEIPYVMNIGDYAFSGCSSLTSLDAFLGVTNIGEGAFSDCTGLVSVVIPFSSTSIGASAFSGCTGLTSLEIFENVTSIEASAFSGCTGLTTVIIANSVTSIGASAFSGCTGLSQLILRDGTTDLEFDSDVFSDAPLQTLYVGRNFTCSSDYDYQPFYNKTTLMDLTIGNNVTSIGACAFFGCTGLWDVEIPNSVESIGYGAFWGCTLLTSVTIGENVTSIGEGAFRGCFSLESVDIPSSVMEIGISAFSDCTSLTSVSIGEGLETISNYAFADCVSLESVVIPSSVTSIGEEAFYGCSELSKVTCGWTNLDNVTTGSYVFESIASENTLYVPNSAKSIYEATSPWSDFTNIVGYETVNITSVGYATFTPTGSVDLTDETDFVAYAVTADSEGNLTFTPVTTIAAGEGVLLESADGGELSKTIYVTSETVDATEGNALVGTLEDIDALETTDGTYKNYILNDGSQGVGFYQANNQSLDAGKAYLQVLASSTAKSFLGLDFGAATGIDGIATTEDATPAAYYNLAGQRVSESAKGIIIVNGKKVIRK